MNIDVEEIQKREGIQPGSAMTEYAAAKRSHEEANWPLLQQLQRLRLLLISSMLTTAIAITCAAVVTIRKPVDHYYAFAVDKAGHLYTLGAPIADTKSLPETARERLLADWLTHARSVLVEWPAQLKYVFSVTAQSRGAGRTAIDAWYVDNRPDVRAKTNTILVDVTNILKVGNSTYDVEWTETPYALDGTPQLVQHWRGRFTIGLDPPLKQEDVNPLNPLGFYVTQFNWSETRA